ncbi:hypothetical protein FB45DRAFT_911203 [Roridomyces roridus]|uniref:F-box domain-containing protein n=1 Tax=Roridomyces roridus TaxID=1738132 RepID=A0AAD7C216_9AGAR|nr:hypothetical protein FB45DRAFT_911203 [Roridomyces roridus]
MLSPTTHSCPRCGYELVQPRQQSDRSARLSELDSLIATLQAERDALQAESDAIVHYPVLSLPPEITGDIFNHCVVPLSIPSSALAPLLLTRICRAWRQIALASPRLWQSLEIPGSLPVTVLDTWLSRTGDVPLDFLFHTLDHSDTLFESMLRRSHQWRDVHFAILPMIFHRINNRDILLPNLREIHLDVCGLDMYPKTIRIRNAPLLREALVTTQANFELPWRQLTSLTLAYKSLVECLGILACCPLLRHLDARPYTLGSAVTQPTLVTLAHLESCTSSFSEHSLLEYLALPRLEQLTFDCIGDRPEYVATLVAFMERSRCRLRELHMPSAGLMLDHFREILLGLPDSVEHLSVSWWHAERADVVFATLGEVEILPRINRLILKGDELSRDGYQSLIDALRARAQATAQISVSVSVHEDVYSRGITVLPDPAQIDQFRELVEGGMEIRLEVSTTVDSSPVVFDWTW